MPAYGSQTKRYRLEFDCVRHCSCGVEAISKEEAKKLARSIPQEEWNVLNETLRIKAVKLEEDPVYARLPTGSPRPMDSAELAEDHRAKMIFAAILLIIGTLIVLSRFFRQ